MDYLDLEKIIKQERLTAFIMGYGEFLTYRPEKGYEKWNKLIDYYRSDEIQNDTKKKIKETILDLFDSANLSSKGASLSLSRIMKIDEIEEKVIQFLQINKLNKLDKILQNDLLVTISHFRIKELETVLIVFVTKNNMLQSFLLWSQTRSDETQASDDDLWRIELIARYYEASNRSIRQQIELQLKNAGSSFTKILTIFKAFLEMDALNKDFQLFIKNNIDSLQDL